MDNILQGSWEQLRGEIKQQWGKLTDDDLSRIKGQRDKLEGTLQEKYGYSKQKARQEVDNYLSAVDSRFNEAQGTVQATVEETQARLAENREKAAEAARERAEQYNKRLEEVATGLPGNPVQVVQEYPWLVIVSVMVVGILIGVLLRPSKS